MEFQEFPKLLYLNGDIEGAYKIAANEQEETVLTDEGYGLAGHKDGFQELVAKAESLGIKVDSRWGEKRLLAEIEKAS